MEHAPAVDNEGIGILARLDPEGKILLEFLVQTILDVSRSHELSVLSEERRVVDREEHAHRRFVDGDRRESFRILDVGNRVADLETVNADNSADVTALDAVHIGLSEAVT